MKTFAGIEKEFSEFSSARIFLQPIPYDGTTTWGKGADKGINAFLEAAENMELYDIETDTEVFKNGIHLLPGIKAENTPELMYEHIRAKTTELLELDRFLTFFGGEHSISIGIVEAFNNKYENLTVLQLDAHADLRESYLGSKYNHACAMHEASKNTNLIQVGVRSMDESENQYMDKKKCFFADQIHSDPEIILDSIDLMTQNVYLSIDLDVFDPSIMPSTGTPEPGGLDWFSTLQYLKEVFDRKNVVGFDIVELSPIEHLNAPNFLAAKLYYKLLSYKFKNNE
jgi:agmatinase